MHKSRAHNFLIITLLSIGLNNLSFAQTFITTPTTFQQIPTTSFIIPSAIQPTRTDNITISPSPTTTTPSTQTPTTTTDPKAPAPTSEVLPTPTPINPAPTQTPTTPQEPVPSNNTPTDTGTTGQIRPRNTPPISPAIPQKTPAPLNCPPLDPLSNQNVECPKVETKTITPKIPTQLIFTPILGVGLFWVFFSILNKQQTKSSQRLDKIHLNRSAQETVLTKRQESYQKLLDFLTTKSLHNELTNSNTYQNISAQIEILGSPKMRSLNQEIQKTLESGKTKNLKPLIQKVITQIKLDS